MLITRSRFVLALSLVIVFVLGARADLDPKRWREVAERLDEILKAQDEKGADKEAATLIREAARDDSERAARYVVKTIAKFPESLEVFRAAHDAIGALRNERALKLLKDDAWFQKDWRVRVILVEGLGKRGALDQAALDKALADKENAVQLAAVKEIARARTIAGVEALCATMAKIEAKGGLRGAGWQAARNALIAILGVEREGGQDFKNYLDENRAKFIEGRGIPAPPAAPRAGREEPDRGGIAGGRRGETVTLFGQAIHCKNVVLIIDVSGSMEIPDPLPEGPGTVLRDPSKGEVDETRRRIYRAKEELKRVLEKLAKAKGKVNVIAYSTEVSPWRPEGLHELGSESLRSACAFVDAFKAEGVTATDLAIQEAFRIAPEADCFYLISDGFATHDGQRKIPTSRILTEVAELNRLRHVQINTLGFVSPFGGTPSADPELMKALAEQTGGTYSEIK